MWLGSAYSQRCTFNSGHNYDFPYYLILTYSLHNRQVEFIGRVLLKM